MANNWQFVDLINFKGILSYSSQKERLIVITEEGEILDTYFPGSVNVIFSGLGVTIAPGVLYHLAKHNIIFIPCDWKGQPTSCIYPWSKTHTRIVERHRAQAAAKLPKLKRAWKELIQSKIQGQANNLFALGNREAAMKLLNLKSAVKSGDATNCEGHAARIYWSTIFQSTGTESSMSISPKNPSWNHNMPDGKSGDFAFRRLPGSHHDFLNSALDYGYTLLRGYSVRAVFAAGLLPTLAMYHRNRANTFALADDLLEPYRPAVDWIIGSTTTLKAFKDVKKSLHENLAKKQMSDGKTIPNSIIQLAQRYGDYLEDSNDSPLKIPCWDGINA